MIIDIFFGGIDLCCVFFFGCCLFFYCWWCFYFHSLPVLDHDGREALLGDLLKSSHMGCSLKNKDSLAVFDASHLVSLWPGQQVKGVVLMALDDAVFDASLGTSATGGAILNVNHQNLGKHGELFLISDIHGLGEEANAIDVAARTQTYTGQLASDMGICGRPAKGSNGKSTADSHHLDKDALNYLSSTNTGGTVVFMGDGGHNLRLSYQHDTSTRTTNPELKAMKESSSFFNCHAPNSLNMSNKKKTSSKKQTNLAKCIEVPPGMREPNNASGKYSPAHARDMCYKGSLDGGYLLSGGLFQVFFSPVHLTCFQSLFPFLLFVLVFMNRSFSVVSNLCFLSCCLFWFL